MKISKKVRDEAIMICLCAASYRWSAPSYARVASELTLRLNSRPAVLALMAWDAVEECGVGVYDRAHDAEAAALLADGWCPGDPVVLLRGGG